MRAMDPERMYYVPYVLLDSKECTMKCTINALQAVPWYDIAGALKPEVLHTFIVGSVFYNVHIIHYVYIQSSS